MAWYTRSSIYESLDFIIDNFLYGTLHSSPVLVGILVAVFESHVKPQVSGTFYIPV